MAVDYNDFVASTTNKQTVLNVLRASRREPMHFTSFSEIVGTVRGTAITGTGAALNGSGRSATRTTTTTANTAAGGTSTGGSVATTATDVANQAVSNYTPNLSLQVSTGTDFKVAANATDEFYKGILNPIAAGTVVNYLRQGFPADLLSNLVVGRLEYWAVIKQPDGTTRTEYLLTAENHPSVPGDIELFTAAIRCRQLDYAPDAKPARQIEAPSVSSFGQQLTPEQLARIEEVLHPGAPSTYRLTIPAHSDFSLAMSDSSDGQCELIRQRLAASMVALTKRLNLTSRSPNASVDSPVGKLRSDGVATAEDDVPNRTRIAPSRVRLESAGYFNRYLPTGYQGGLAIDITLRSVEGVIYYLGEYIRSETPPVLLSGGETCSGFCLPILRVRPAKKVSPGDRFAQIDYRGETYAVPLSGMQLGQEAGRSSQTIGLVQQLLNLNRSAKDLPSTPLVRVYN